MEYTINLGRVGGRKTENLKLRYKTELTRRKSDGNLKEYKMLSKCDKNINYVVVKLKRPYLVIQAISRIFSNPHEFGEKLT